MDLLDFDDDKEADAACNLAFEHLAAEARNTFRREIGRYPWLAELHERFVVHLLEQRPGTRIEYTPRSTVRIIQRNRGQVGLYPRPAQGGLHLWAIRKGERHYEFIKTDEDFVRVLEWLEGLPGDWGD